jgi:hypothetical protein
MPFALESADEDFLASAPQRYSYSMDLPVPPERVWAVLAGDEPMDFVRGLKIRWTSPAPRGVGAKPTARGCRFTWVFAVEPRGPRPFAAANGSVQRTIFARMARDFGKHFGG